jgi:hypothetical protein
MNVIRLANGEVIPIETALDYGPQANRWNQQRGCHLALRDVFSAVIESIALAAGPLNDERKVILAERCRCVLSVTAALVRLPPDYVTPDVYLALATRLRELTAELVPLP